MAKEIPISSIEGLQEELDKSVRHQYADVAALLDNQSEQDTDNLIRVDDASADPNVTTGPAYYHYTGAATADLGDYYLVSAPDSGGGGGGGGPEADTWYVNINGNDATGDGSPQTPYATLSKAVTEASAGDVIYVGKGVNFLSSPITKSLTIIGNSAFGSQISGATLILPLGNFVDTTSGNISLTLKQINVSSGITFTGGNTFDLYTFGCFLQQNVTASDLKIHATQIGVIGGSSGNVTCVALEVFNSFVKGDVNVTNGAILNGSFIDGNIDLNSTALALSASFISGTISNESSLTLDTKSSQLYYDNSTSGLTAENVQTAIDEVAASGGGGAPLETIQTLTVVDGNRTSALVLNADTNIVKVTLDATLTDDWAPSSITGWVEGRNYAFHIIKNSNNGVDMTTARAVPNVGYDDDIDPFAALVDVDTTQKRAVIQAIGFKSTFGQFGRLVLTDSNYVE